MGVCVCVCEIQVEETKKGRERPKLGSNTYDAFLLISELINGRRKGSIVVLEGKLGSGWRGFGLHLRKAIDPESLAPKQAITGMPKRDASKSFASVVVGNRKTNGGGGDEGKYKSALIQNTDTCKESFLGQRVQPGVKFLSVPSCNSRVICKESSLGGREQLGEKILSDFSLNLDSGEANFSGLSDSGAEVIGFTGDMGFSSVVAVVEPPTLTELPPILRQEPWVAQNGFSPPSISSNGTEAEFGVDDSGCGSGGKDICVLECEPLSQWEPKDLSEGLLGQDSVEGTQGTESGPPSNWVSQLMKIFCKMVGFPIVKHEAQCLALFRILEQECLKVNDDGVSKRNANSGTRGLRELKGLISYVNYNGASSRGRSKASSTTLGGCW
ncbi:hypothetical protein SO802_026920 [Lithocarpus litseifolius]|uniref:Uncharacterized protein n=1 Tax=Lithocarpus litseifolius TaxID=425828 RepID=A0AAW2C6H5_9ROSI